MNCQKIASFPLNSIFLTLATREGIKLNQIEFSLIPPISLLLSSYILDASSSEERTSWVEAINQASK